MWEVAVPIKYVLRKGANNKETCSSELLLSTSA
jgi:hypothetical protein